MSEVQILNLMGDGLLFGILALGLHVSFEWGRFPDLTPDGSFVIGALAYYLAVTVGVHPTVALVPAAVAGALAGFATAVLAELAKLPSMVAGLLVGTASYSVVWVLLGKPNAFISRDMTIWGGASPDVAALEFVGAAMTSMAVVIVLLSMLANTVYGMRLRAVNENRLLAADLGLSTLSATALALCVGNSLVGLAGGLFAQRAFSVDLNMGTGITISGLAAAVLGSVIGSRSRRFGLSAIVLGGVSYKALMFFALRIGLPAELFKLVTATLLVVVFVVAARSRKTVLLANLRWT